MQEAYTTFPACRVVFQMKYSVTYSFPQSLHLWPSLCPVALPVLWNNTAQSLPHIHFSFFFVMFCQQGPPSRRIVSFYTRYSPQRDLPSHWHNSCLSSLAAGLCELPLGKMPMAPHLLHYPNSSCCPDTSSYVLTNCRPLTEFSGITHLEMACDRQECHKTASAAPQSLWSLAV